MDLGSAVRFRSKAERRSEVGVDSLLRREPLEGELVILRFLFGVEVDTQKVEVELVVLVYLCLIPYTLSCFQFANMFCCRTIRVHEANKR